MVVSNSAGSAQSNPVTVTVITVPAITTQPASVTINQGQTTVLSVAASGPSLVYQWRFNGNEIAGANAASYSTGIAGSYTAVVTNPAGSVTSNAATVTVVGLPSISSHPASVTINQGQSTVLSVVASGDSLQYQWQLAGNNLAGANAASYTTGVAGSYTVVVTNPAGSVTSNPATVTVVGLPSITTHPAPVTINQGQTTRLCVAADGPSLSYEWQMNTVPITGANAACHDANTAGSYRVIVQNSAGSVTSNAATVTVIVPPVFTTHPASTTINRGQTANLTAAASGTSPTYQWQLNGADIPGATSSIYPATLGGIYRAIARNSAGSVTSNPATVTVIDVPTITCPASVTINRGQTTTLIVTATGPSLSYQWRRNGTVIEGATASSYLTGVEGNYTAIVSNPAGSITCDPATVTVIDPPVITTQPASVTIKTGETAQLRVVATTGGATLSYQWRLNSANVAGGTGPTLSTTTQGDYTVVVTNRAGSATSAVATVTVVGLPTVSIDPASATINLGERVNLRALASGTGPFTYQWLVGGTPVGTAETYTTGTAGTYTVTVTGAGGSSSATARVDVITPPVITAQPVSTRVEEGGTATFAVKADGANLRYQWYRVVGVGGEGELTAAIEGATSATYSTGTAGRYNVIVTNSAGSRTSDTVTLTVITGLPVILTHPESASLPAGRTHTMSVKASGTGLTYQWYEMVAKVPQAIKGANAVDYTTGTTGSYFVRVRNAAGAVDSNLAEVRFTGGAPVITRIDEKCGSTACQWTVVATGITPMTYQWYLMFATGAREPIGGETSPTFTSKGTGTYFVIITNAVDSTQGPALSFPPR